MKSDTILNTNTLHVTFFLSTFSLADFWMLISPEICFLSFFFFNFMFLSWVVNFFGTSLVAQMVKRLLTMWETWVQSLGREDLLRKKWQPAPVFLPGKSHGWRSLVGYSSWGRKESDTTEWLHSLFSSWSPLSPSILFSSLCNSVYLSGCPSLWRNFSSLT